MNLIERQIALDAVDAIGHIATMPDGDKCIRRSAVNYTLSMLPSAQLEIIRCKDCKDFRRWVNTDITFCALTEGEVCEDDFCSRAERRTDEQPD